MPEGEEAEGIVPFPGVPWSIDFAIVEDAQGKTWVAVYIHTHTAQMILYADPTFSHKVAGIWQTMAQKAKHNVGVRSPGIDVPKIDVSSTIRQIREEQSREHP